MTQENHASTKQPPKYDALLLKTHTVICMVGPTNCGKTDFSDRLVKILRNTKADFRVSYIGSDQCREDVISGFNTFESWGKYDPLMNHASHSAFKLLHAKLEVAMTYPTNSEFIVLDTTGMNEEFRKQVIEATEKYNYNLIFVLFDYAKSHGDYFSGTLQPGMHKDVVRKAVDKFRKETISSVLRRNTSYKSFKVTSHHGARNCNVIIENIEEFVQTMVYEYENYTIVGDVHESLDEFKQLMTKLKYYNEATDSLMVPEKDCLILVGDLVDKSGKTKETVEFFHRNRSQFKYVDSNHESFVYKSLTKKDIGSDLAEEFINKYFSSLQVLKGDPELAAKFIELYETAVPFVYHEAQHLQDAKSFIVTHAPCEQIYLGKLDKISKGKQRNFRRKPDQTDAYEFLKQEAHSNYPYHIFGHVPVEDVERFSNKFAIDTGCASGGKLTAMQLSHSQGRPYFTSVQCMSDTPFVSDIPDNPKFERVFSSHIAFTVDQLTEESQRRYRKLVKHKVNFVSGTMSPVDKKEGTLEDLETGLEYYKKKGITQVVLQPKYMGSRFQLYLNKNEPTASYGVSRNGFVPKWLKLDELYAKLVIRYESVFQKHNADLLIIDGELLPWAALGKGLIANTYKVIGSAINYEQHWLEATGFTEQLAKFNVDNLADTAKQSSGKLNHFKKQWTWNPEIDLADAVAKYLKQVEIYGSDLEVDFAAFSLLKAISIERNEDCFVTDGTQNPFDDYNQFYPEIQCYRVDFHDPYSVSFADNFYQQLVDSNMEGVVIKPIDWKPGIAPYLKARNPEYLRLIYGYDYLESGAYERIVERKDIRRKLSTSIKEWQLSMKLLAIPYHEIAVENDEYLQLLGSLLLEVDQEATIDPHL